KIAHVAAQKAKALVAELPAQEVGARLWIDKHHRFAARKRMSGKFGSDQTSTGDQRRHDIHSRSSVQSNMAASSAMLGPNDRDRGVLGGGMMPTGRARRNKLGRCSKPKIWGCRGRPPLPRVSKNSSSPPPLHDIAGGGHNFPEKRAFPAGAAPD